MVTAQAALSGVLLGGLYALMAIGLSITWGMLKVINLAHFALILVGAYLTYEISTSWGVDPLLTLVVTVPTLFVAGALLQWAYDVLHISEVGSLLVSFGVLVITNQVVSNVWSADFRRMSSEVNPYSSESVRVGELVFSVPSLLSFVAALVIVTGVSLVLGRTFGGRALRAFSEDHSVAAAFGIDHRRIGVLVGGAVAASAALAGMLYSLSNALTPSTSFEWFGIVFAVVILGGIGNVVGTLLSGVLVGALTAIVSVTWSPAAAPLVLFCAIVLALVLRPQGLLGSKGAHA
jgi:branched-chain amino acid transport system permease protein